MLVRAVFLVSLSAISIEILLARVFSISQWNHLSFMVISIALFGFAASGTFLNILESRKPHFSKSLAENDRIKLLTVLFTLSAILSFVLLNLIPLDYIRLPLEPIQAFYLLTTYIILALPFFFTGLITSIAYTYFSEKSGLVYMASMTGSACGAVIPAPFLPILSEPILIILCALIPMVIIPFGESRTPFFKKRSNLIFLLIIIAACFILPFNLNKLTIRMSPYKALSHLLRFPDTIISETTTGIRGRIDSVKSPYIRFAPGMSLKFKGKLPAQWAVFKDGDTPFNFYNLSETTSSDFSSYSLSFTGYQIHPDPENVLIIQNGGGLAIPCARKINAKKITVIEQHPDLADRVKTQYSLPVINSNPSAYLKRNDTGYDIIHLENWGSTLPGTAALLQDNTLTRDSFLAYLNHLKDNGIIIVSRKLLLPPSDSIRLWATAYESLRSYGIIDPENHIILLRNWDTFTLLVFVTPVTNTSAIEELALRKNFDIVFLNNIDQSRANRFNIFDQPFHFTEIKMLAAAYQNRTEQEA